MKILTNYHSGNIGGIGQVLSSFIEFIRADNRTKFNIVGVEFSPSIPTKRTEVSPLTLIQRKIDLPKISETIKKQNNLDEVRSVYGDLIQSYEDLIRQESPDIILVNGTFFIPWCLLNAAKKFKIPIIVHYHGSLTKETEHWDPKSHAIFKAMEKEFDSGKTHYVFPSKLSREVVETEVFGHKITNVAILPNPVPLHFFDRTPFGKRRKIGIVTRKAKVKNTDFILHLAKYNAKQKDNFEINLVSDLTADDRYRKKLEGLVNFIKPVKNQRLSKFYSKMGIVISPSHFETYGNVPKEALASGIPALISRRMGVAETFTELGLDDWIVDFRSVKTVYKKIKEISGTNVAEEIRNKIKDSYSPERIHKRFVEIINSI